MEASEKSQTSLPTLPSSKNISSEKLDRLAMDVEKDAPAINNTDLEEPVALSVVDGDQAGQEDDAPPLSYFRLALVSVAVNL
jgi:hypothetical protein